MIRAQESDEDSPANWYRLDKSALSIANLGDPPDHAKYWRTRPVAERLEAIEYLRWMNHGEAAFPGRLQRVLEIVQRT